MSGAPNITLATLSMKAGFKLRIRILGEVPVKCLSIDVDGFITTTTDQGKLHSLQIDRQAHIPGLSSLRGAITTTYGAAVWLSPGNCQASHQPGLPTMSLTTNRTRTPPGLFKTRTNLTLLDDQDEDEEISDEEPDSPDMPTKGWIGLRTVRLNAGRHRVIRLTVVTRGCPSATSGDI